MFALPGVELRQLLTFLCTIFHNRNPLNHFKCIFIYINVSLRAPNPNFYGNLVFKRAIVEVN